MKKKFPYFYIISINDLKIFMFCKVHFLTQTFFFQDLMSLKKTFGKVYNKMIEGEKWGIFKTLTSFSYFQFKTQFYKVHWDWNLLEIWISNGLSTINFCPPLCATQSCLTFNITKPLWPKLMTYDWFINIIFNLYLICN